ncbi:lytic murein transglycosylase [Sphingomonas lutea]|uniref:Lytic murein transglycosylase n=2 Tax=Sphingomonas lutea TaxID=1045317 RepID=A0A7G9SFM2_9SPHN|nr:lytic murein transglycosylase [Sphingomonas lutea]QNN66647.1 lytic murein transglycosylase [Sphingomonas lutea]
MLAVTSAMALATPSAQPRPSAIVAGPAPVQVAQLTPVYPQPVYPQPVYPQPAYAPPPQSAWDGYKVRLAALARQQGVREATIQAVVPYLRLNQRAMDLDRAQRPTSTRTDYAPASFGPYLTRHITSSLISRGQARYSSHWANLSRIQAMYGVDPAVIIAIYGKETSYGAVTGSFDLLDALASLAYEGRRRQMFEDEFLAALKLMDQGVQRWQLKGSYAGATGYPQFMPTVALRLRADGDADGYADIWRNEDDAFASIANYLRNAGWKRDMPWGVPVAIPGTLNRAAVQSRLNPPRCPNVYRRHSRWLTVAQWRSMGVMPTGRTLPDTELVALMETPGAYAQGYLLTGNYRAILDYNCSNYYAMGVGLLANAIARR